VDALKRRRRKKEKKEKRSSEKLFQALFLPQMKVKHQM
jgi:hypothetical protein